jgi:hypothetical protein
MALLGYGGILDISREWPEPMALAFEAINLNSSPRTISLGNENYWTGDRVLFNFPSGSPYDQGSPGGRGMYFGGIFELSNAKQHVTALDDEYYKTDNTALFYDNGTPETVTSGYIRIDALGRIRLFTTEIAAHNLLTENEILLKAIRTENFVVARYSENSIYTTALTTVGNSIVPLTLPSDNQELKTVINPPAGLDAISNDPAERGWLFQADLQEWALDIDAANLDMTAIGETFGENTKSVVRGAGSLQFLVEHRPTDEGQDSLALLRLVLLTQKGCKSNARFWLYKDRDANCGRISGSVYYQCDLLLTNSRINTRADQLIVGSTDFVATGDIEVKFAP